MTSTTQPTIAPQRRHTWHWPARAIAILATTAILALLATIITVGLGVEIQGPTFADAPPVEVGIGAVTAVTLLTTLLGWALLAALERWTVRPRPIWTTSAIAVTILSLVPLSGDGAIAGTRAVLGASHLLVAAIYIPLMVRTVANRPDGRS